MIEKGILTGCDQTMEKFLPWWFEHVRAHHDEPVAIVDFGMSEWGQNAAKKMGILIPKQDLHIQNCRDEIAKKFRHYQPQVHTVFMHKPISLYHSPFKHTLWLDIDCKVVTNLSELFDIDHFGVVLDDEKAQQWGIDHQAYSSSKVKNYNSGVISCKKGCPLLESWAKLAAEESHHFAGDDLILAELIAKNIYSITTLPLCYNTRWNEPVEDAKVLHYRNLNGKIAIIEEMLFRICG